MKKILLIAVAGILSGYAAYAQNKIRFGAKAGINVSVFNKHLQGFGEGQGSEFYNFHKYPRFSLNAGLTADVKLSTSFSFGTELLYSGQGSAYRIKNEYVVITTNSGGKQDAYDYLRFRINYLEVPLLAKYTFNTKPTKSSFTIYGGLSPAVNISTGTRFAFYDLEKGSANNVPVKNEDEELENVRGFNLSGVLGLQIGSAPTTKGLYMDFRFANTLLPVFTSSATYANNTRMFTGSWGFGYRF